MVKRVDGDLLTISQSGKQTKGSSVQSNKFSARVHSLGWALDFCSATRGFLTTCIIDQHDVDRQTGHYGFDIKHFNSLAQPAY